MGDLRKGGEHAQWLVSGDHKALGSCLVTWMDEASPVGSNSTWRHYPDKQQFQVVNSKGYGGAGLVFLVELHQRDETTIEVDAYRSYEYFSRLGIINEIKLGVDACSAQRTAAVSVTASPEATASLPDEPSPASQRLPKAMPIAERLAGHTGRQFAGIECDSVDVPRRFSPNDSLSEERILIRPSKPLSDASRITCSYDAFLTDGKRRTQLKEEGTYKGLSFRIYYDGSGTIQGGADRTMALTSRGNWSTYCSLDPIADLKYCSISIANLNISTTTKGKYRANIGHKHYPGTDMTFRADKNSPIQMSESNNWFSAAQTNRLMAQMHAAKVVHTQYRRWPNQSSSTQSFRPYKTEVAVEILDWLLANLKDP